MIVTILNKVHFRHLHKSIVVLFFSILSLAGYSQENVSEHNIKVLGRVQEDKILLRWAPTTAVSWLRTNKYGYTIERYTVFRKGVLLNPPEKKIITTSLIPLPLEKWKDKVENNDYAAIIAQALYGESFDVEQQQGGLAQIINTSKEIEQRFSFALFASDLNFEAAKMAALGYEDTDVKTDEEYFYKIISNVPTELIAIEPGLITVKMIPPDPLPKPIDLVAVPEDKSILLTWEYAMFKPIYNAYFVERSEDGNNFKRLGDTPLVNLNDKPETPARRMFYVDTIAQNNKTYYYRVIGVSSFGEEGQPSEIVSAQGVKKLSSVPHISKHEFDISGNVVITWDFAKSAETEITGFELNWAAQEKGPYKTVKTGISSNTRKVVYSEPEPSNYFRVAAIGKNNQKTSSLTAFVQTIDSIPPTAPTGVSGVIDSLGVVKLNWEANKEKDLLGYRIFRGNLKNEEVSQLTVSPVLRTTFIDTVQVASLNSKVYYQIVAVDQRFNMSEFSEKLTLEKPDIIPPSSPIFAGYSVKNDGVLLKWINSSSEDVIAHQLYRQEVKEADKGWALVFKTDTVTSFVDQKLKPDTKYRYAIFAEDKSALRSIPSTPITVTSQKTSDKELIKGFSAIADRINKQIVITWRKMPEEVIEILIYKSKKEGKPVLWKQIPASISKLVDSSVSPNNTYIYQLKVVTRSGGSTAIQKEEIIF